MMDKAETASKRIYYSPLCQNHQVSQGHPECPERLQAIVDFLEQEERLSNWQWIEPSVVSQQWFEYAHPAQYVKKMFACLPAKGEPLIYLDGDTCWSAESGIAVNLAGGALKQAIDWVIKNSSPQIPHTAFCLNRPPGHHAELTTPMGFCVFSLLANAAIYAHKEHSLERVAILDFDVHHGNGTENVLANYPTLFFASSYQEGIFPAHTKAQKTTHRIYLPMPALTNSQTFRKLWEEEIFSQLQDYQPQLLLVSAGFDAHINDPLANCCLTEEDYFWLGKKIKNLSVQNKAPIIANLEGGYHLNSLAQSTGAFLQGVD
jgi:acetoin utilization deacetylase AcuC-like enzyme